ncbi:type II secretion system protein GspG [uncultured Shewanella sp.]|uniref:type II secretion system protein GspG n=1 Tax=uncultured Shewanella sp. TaxID=173975 RepID=UPI00262C5E3C|nr:type II secretion system protein GspG [uncultured Shewanella sp.]
MKGHFSEGEIYDDLVVKQTKIHLTSVIQAIEFYKVQNGHYPETLQILEASLPENAMVFLYDASQGLMQEPQYLYYHLISENQYHIRAYGRDGLINTSDDILPLVIENIGLVVEGAFASDL